MSKTIKQELQSTNPGEVLNGEESAAQRLGFMQGEIDVPDDFDQKGKDKIARSFQAASLSTCGYRFNRDGANKR